MARNFFQLHPSEREFLFGPGLEQLEPPITDTCFLGSLQSCSCQQFKVADLCSVSYPFTMGADSTKNRSVKKKPGRSEQNPVFLLYSCGEQNTLHFLQKFM